jgi:Leucine-rich repeat (LRR) protein
MNVSVVVLSLLSAAPEFAEMEQLCATPYEEKALDALANQLKQRNTIRVLDMIGNVPDDQRGALVRRSAAQAGISSCALADELNTRFGVDVTGCRKESSECFVSVLSAEFVTAFEKRADRETKLLVLSLPKDTPLVIPKGLLSVRSLSLEGNNSLVDLSPIENVAGLKVLSLERISVVNFTPLKKLKKLTALSVNKVTTEWPIDFDFLNGLQSLRTLSFTPKVSAPLVPVRQSGLAVTVNALPGLQVQEVPNTSLGPFAALKNLESLEFDNVPTLDFSPIGKLAKLKVLKLPRRFPAVMLLKDGAFVPYQQETKNDLSFLKKLHQLEELNANSFGLNDDLAHFESLINLIKLDLGGNTHLTTIDSLSKLSKLQSLILRNTGVKNVAAISKLNSLVKLDLGSTKVSDVQPIFNLKKLENVVLTDITQTQQTSLKAALPNLKVRLEQSATPAKK